MKLLQQIFIIQSVRTKLRGIKIIMQKRLSSWSTVKATKITLEQTEFLAENSYKNVQYTFTELSKKLVLQIRVNGNPPGAVISDLDFALKLHRA